MFGKTEVVKLTKKFHNYEVDMKKFKQRQEKVNIFPMR